MPRKTNKRQTKQVVPNPGPQQPIQTPEAAPPSNPPIAQSKQTETDQVKTLIEALEQVRGTRVIVYWMTEMARISEAVGVPLYDHLCTIGKQDGIDLLLYTGGGDTEAPWRIVSLIREYCNRFGVLIPHRAHSAGTLLALGADEIVMSPLAVLGPIDPARTHPLLPRREGATEAEPISVQDMRHAMQFIHEAAGEMAYTPEALAQIIAALFEKIHPLAIGAIEQSYALSKLVATQCLRTHMDRDKEGAQIETIVNRLCDDYKSHAYQICRNEARTIGLTWVVDACPPVEAAMMDLYRFYVSRRVPPPTMPAKGRTVKLPIAWLDSTAMNMRVEADFAVEPGKLKLLGDSWNPY